MPLARPGGVPNTNISDFLLPFTDKISFSEQPIMYFPNELVSFVFGSLNIRNTSLVQSSEPHNFRLFLNSRVFDLEPLYKGMAIILFIFLEIKYYLELRLAVPKAPSEINYLSMAGRHSKNGKT